MKTKIPWLMLSIIITLSMIFTACPAETTPTPTPTKPPTTGSPTATPEAHWWDKLGEPKYGGTLTFREGDMGDMNFDPSNPFGSQYTDYWMESLFCPDWTVDREEWKFNVGFTPEEYMAGLLAESWERTDPQTVVVKLRQGVKWQDKPPVNGREFTAEDVVYSFDWSMGTGSGFTEPNPMWYSSFPSVERVVATDKYTVEFRLKSGGAMTIFQVIAAAMMRAYPIIAREWYEQGDLNNWENAVGTGAWLLTDYVAGSSLTLSRNPNYYLNDERYPQNQLPYLDTIKSVAIPDLATSVAALRTGKVDMIVQTRGGLSWQQGETLAKSNPEIQQVLFPNPGFCLDMRCDHEPFTDIRVRKALQMALDLKTIAKTHYSDTVSGDPAGEMSPQYEGYALPFDEWPADLQAEYSYNPTRARELLAEAGYPNGFPTNCVASTADDMELLEIMKSMFMDIGVDMEIKSMDPNTFRALTSAGEADQLIMSNGTAMPFGPDRCIRIRQSHDRDNFAENNDPVYDAMINQFDNAPTIEECQRISVEADFYLLRQHWAVQTCATAIIFAWQPRVKGYMGEIIIGSSWLAHVPTHLWVED